MLHHVTYVSSAARPFNSSDLAQLLRLSRMSNERDDISGMLLYRDGNFMQTYEGPEEAVARLTERISRDPRHTGIIVLLDGNREERQFEGWAMGFRDLTNTDLRDEPGYSDFMNTPLTAEAYANDPSAALRLLLAFKRSTAR